MLEFYIIIITVVLLIISTYIYIRCENKPKEYHHRSTKILLDAYNERCRLREIEEKKSKKLKG